MEDDGSATSACQKLLNKMLGERTYSAQETAHLLLGLPLVRTSVSFASVNLAAQDDMREILGPDEVADVADDGERVVTGKSWLQR